MTTEQLRTEYQDDPALGRLLARLSGMQGIAVPALQFGMPATTQTGVPFADISLLDQARERWLHHFGSGALCRYFNDLSQAKDEDFPLVWQSPEGKQVLLLRARLANGDCVGEHADGEVVQLARDTLVNTSALALKASVASTGSKNAPRSARDWFLHAIGLRKRIFFEAALASLLVSAVGLFSALYTMQVYDRVVPTQGLNTLWVLTVGVVIAIFMELILKQVRSAMVDRACKAIDEDLSSVFFGKALDIRLESRPRTVGTFASQIRHFESVRNFMTSSTLFVLADLPFALAFIVIIYILAGYVAIVPVVAIPLAFLISLSFRRPMLRHTSQQMDASNRKNGMLIDAIDGIESIKAVHAEWKLLARWRLLTRAIATNELAIRNLSVLSTNITQSVQQFNYVGIVAVGAYAITQGDLTMGGLIACTIISGRALGPLTQVPSMVVQWQHASIALKALDGIMAMPSEREHDQQLVLPQDCLGEVQAEGLGFSYDNGVTVLDVPALALRAGERVAVLGAVGCGKSTLIKILSGLYRPQQGKVYLDGVDMSHLAPSFVREHLGYLPQDVRLFEGSLRDNLTLGLPNPSDSQILRAATMTGLDHAIRQHPKGLSLPISEGGRGLSGGQRQLVGLTRMLIAQPRVLLLDEPTASMDNRTETVVMRHLFQQIPKESSIILVTHKLSLLEHVRRVIVMDKGKIVADGPRDVVLAKMRVATNQAQNN